MVSNVLSWPSSRADLHFGSLQRAECWSYRWRSPDGSDERSNYHRFRCLAEIFKSVEKAKRASCQLVCFLIGRFCCFYSFALYLQIKHTLRKQFKCWFALIQKSYLKRKKMIMELDLLSLHIKQFPLIIHLFRGNYT